MNKLNYPSLMYKKGCAGEGNLAEATAANEYKSHRDNTHVFLEEEASRDTDATKKKKMSEIYICI
jgi:hypothetical protein